MATPPRNAPRRLFIGLWPPADVRAAIADARGRFLWPRGTRLTPAAKLHLTLHFLGDVSSEDERKLRDALADLDVPAFDLTLREPQNWRSGLVVWLPDEEPALLALREQVAMRMARAGLVAQRPWTPHVTLARDAAGATPPQMLPPLAWPVRDVALVWSRPREGYEVLQIYS